MSFHQLFCNNASIAEQAASPFLLEIDPNDRGHLRALRLQEGEHLRVVDASMDYFEVEIERIENDQLWVSIACHLEEQNDAIPLTLVQGFAKGEKMDTILRQTTELGIAQFAPALMQRSVVQLDAKKTAKRHQRAQAIARSAAQQAGRVSLPAVLPARPLKAIVADWKSDDMVLLFWEEAPLDRSVRALFTELEGSDLLARIERAWVVVGPEGGLAPEEVALIEQSPAQVFTCSLGATILRTETAGVVACALALSELRALQESDL